MKFRYSPDVDILMVDISHEPYGYGEDNEGVIVHHGKDGKPLRLEILDGKLFVMFANTSLATGREVINPEVPEVPFTKVRNVSIRTIPKGNADLRFKYQTESDTLTVKFGDGISDFCRRNNELTVYYDKNELPTGLEIEKARQLYLGTMQSVLLQEDGDRCLTCPASSTRSYPPSGKSWLSPSAPRHPPPSGRPRRNSRRPWTSTAPSRVAASASSPRSRRPRPPAASCPRTSIRCALAGTYVSNGASAVSCLTDPRFQGELGHLASIKRSGASGHAPVLRKDFIFDPYQVYEARAAGADAILLIVAILEPSLLSELLETARSLGLQCLVEVHDEAELETAVDAGAGIIGINNRDLHTFTTDLAVTQRLAPQVPGGKVVVSESGIFTPRRPRPPGRGGSQRGAGRRGPGLRSRHRSPRSANSPATPNRLPPLSRWGKDRLQASRA